MMILTAQVPCCDREEVLPGLLIGIVLGLQGQESNETVGSSLGHAHRIEGSKWHLSSPSQPSEALTQAGLRYGRPSLLAIQVFTLD